MHLAAIGHTKIDQNTSYPPSNHPIGRAFSWERGRVMHTLQIVAIRSGQGEIEWMRERRQVERGSVFILKPGEWHRYRPSKETGWVEDWFEMRGHLPEYWLSQGLFKDRFITLESPSRFFENMDKLHHSVCSNNYMVDGFSESIACGLVCEITASDSERGVSISRVGEREMIAEARQLLTEGFDITTTAKRLGVSYLTLYRNFKRITGLAPKQYAEQARLANAEGLLSGDQLSIKEIAAELGYNSASHFSLAFKRCYGVAPAVWRENLNEL